MVQPWTHKNFVNWFVRGSISRSYQVATISVAKAVACAAATVLWTFNYR